MSGRTVVGPAGSDQQQTAEADILRFEPPASGMQLVAEEEGTRFADLGTAEVGSSLAEVAGAYDEQGLVHSHVDDR